MSVLTRARPNACSLAPVSLAAERTLAQSYLLRLPTDGCWQNVRVQRMKAAKERTDLI